MNDTAATVRQIIEECLGLSALRINATHRLTDDLGASSLDRAEIVFALEEALGIVIDDRKAQGWSTVADVIAAVKAAKGETP